MKNDQREQARNLYFETGLTQGQIATLLEISQKTMSMWVTDGQWQRLKRLAKEMPGIAIENMLTEMAELNDTVRQRPVGKRYATLEEAEIRRKTLASIKYVQMHQSPASHIQVLMNFILYMKPLIAHPELKNLVKHADNYLKAEEFIKPDVRKWQLHKFTALPEKQEQQEAQKEETKESISKEIDAHLQSWAELYNKLESRPGNEDDNEG